MDEDSPIPAPVESRIVYIRAIDPNEIPEEARARVNAEAFYGIHDINGNRLAVVTDREMAFHIARQHEMTPVSAH